MSTLSIRLPNSLHQHTKRLAEQEGISINQFISSAVAEKLSALDTQRYLKERAQRGKGVDIGAILAKIPYGEPDEQDRMVMESPSAIAISRAQKRPRKTGRKS
jgi:hypothetical protein